jgi:hypothetical protein
MDAASEPLLGSVRQKAAVHSPVASLGRYLAFCSSLPAMRSPYNRVDIDRKISNISYPSCLTNLQSNGLMSCQCNSNGAI